MSTIIPPCWSNIPKDFVPQIKNILKPFMKLCKDVISDTANMFIKNIGDEDSTQAQINNYKLGLTGPCIFLIILLLLLILSLTLLPCCCIFWKITPINGTKKVINFGIESIILSLSFVSLIICLVLYWIIALEINKTIQFAPMIGNKMAAKLLSSTHRLSNDLDVLNFYTNMSIDSLTMKIHELPDEQVKFIEKCLGNEYDIYRKKSKESMALLTNPSQLISDKESADFEEFNAMHRVISSSCALFDSNKLLTEKEQYEATKINYQSYVDNVTISKEKLQKSLEQSLPGKVLENFLIEIKKSYNETDELQFQEEEWQRAKLITRKTLQLTKYTKKFADGLNTIQNAFLRVQKFIRSGIIYTSYEWLKINIWFILIILPSIICIGFLIWLFLSCIVGLYEMSTTIKSQFKSETSTRPIGPTVRLLNILLIATSLVMWIIFMWALIFYVIFYAMAVSCHIAKNDLLVHYLDQPNSDHWNGQTWLDYNIKESGIIESIQSSSPDPWVAYIVPENLTVANLLDECQDNAIFATLKLDDLIFQKYFNLKCNLNYQQLSQQTKIVLGKVSFQNGGRHTSISEYKNTMSMIDNLIQLVTWHLKVQIKETDAINATKIKNYCKLLKKQHNLTVFEQVMGDNYDNMVLLWSLKHIQENMELLQILSLPLDEKLKSLADTSMDLFFREYSHIINNELFEMKSFINKTLQRNVGKCDMLPAYYAFTRSLFCEHLQYTFFGGTLFLFIMGVFLLLTLFLVLRMKQYLIGTLNYHAFMTDDRNAQRYQSEIARQIAYEVIKSI